MLLLDVLLAKAFYSGGIPFRFVENKFFKEFLNRLRPQYNVPTRRRIGGPLLQSVYEECKESSQFDATSFLSLQIDGWSNCRNERILGVLSTDEKRRARVEDSIFVGSEKEDAGHVKAKLEKIFDRLGPDRLISVTSDHAPNMKNALQLLREDPTGKYEHVVWQPCVCHLLHLVQQHIVDGQDALKETMKKFVGLAKLIVRSVILRPEVEKQTEAAASRTTAAARQTTGGASDSAAPTVVLDAESTATGAVPTTVTRQRMERGRGPAQRPGGAAGFGAWEVSLARKGPFRTRSRSPTC